jgi:enoyl-CoA hydratase
VSYLLPKIVGPTLAFEMMLTGRLIDAQEALRTGLVLRVVPDGDVVDAALEIARAIVANAPFGVRMTKEVMWANLDAPSLEAAIALEDRTQILTTFGADQREAITAFIQKRPASYTNR